jgi:membrane protein
MTERNRLVLSTDRSALWPVLAAAALIAVGFRPSPRERHSSGGRAQQRALRPQGGPAAPAGEDAGRPGVDEADRGRSASKPSEIPARGWKDILLRVKTNIGEDRIVVIAAGVTFYVVLAIFPAIAALVAIYGFFADPATIASELDGAAGFLPGGALDVIRTEITRLSAQKSALGITFIVGLLASLWSANAGMKSIFDALNLVYSEPEKRGFFKLNAASLLFTVSAILFLLIALGAVVVLPVILGFIGLGDVGDIIVRVARWPALFVLASLALAFVFRYGPSRREARWRWITWGSAFAALCWIVTSLLFSWYAQNFGSYNKTYGSLGAIIAFMMWIWLSSIVVLLGAELDAEMEHQTVRDTTVGGEKRLGRRGARMADTVGQAQD